MERRRVKADNVPRLPLLGEESAAFLLKREPQQKICVSQLLREFVEESALEQLERDFRLARYRPNWKMVSSYETGGPSPSRPSHVTAATGGGMCGYD
jgi:hypothetical protein